MSEADGNAALQPTAFINSQSEPVRDFVDRHAGTGSDRERAIRLYYAMRDAIPYDMRHFGIEPHLFVASNVLAAPAAFCVPKAIALAATARAAGIPARIGFADVRNHLSTPRMLELIGTDVFYWHAFTVLHLDGQWVKATPAFDLAFCRKFNVKPLDFDGRSNSIFHEFDPDGRRHMDYVLDRGSYDDMPIETFAAEMRSHYPRLVAASIAERT